MQRVIGHVGKVCRIGQCRSRGWRNRVVVRPVRIEEVVAGCVRRIIDRAEGANGWGRGRRWRRRRGDRSGRAGGTIVAVEVHPAKGVGPRGGAGSPGCHRPGAVDVAWRHVPAHPVDRQNQRPGSIVVVLVVELTGVSRGERVERVQVVVGGVAGTPRSCSWSGCRRYRTNSPPGPG